MSRRQGSPEEQGAWRRIRNSGKTKNFLVFLIFVFIAALFWVIMTLNDDVQKSFRVKLVIDQVPDSVTFISEPPARLRVTVKDRGTTLLRHTLSGSPELHLSFDDFIEGDCFRVTHSRLTTQLKHLFGASANISAVSPDSLHLLFTTMPGRRIPVEVRADVTAAPGMVVAEKPQVSTAVVTLYSQSPTDTLRRLTTNPISLRNLDKSTTVEAPLNIPPGTRAVPSSVAVTFNVESLVRKESDIAVEPDNIPLGRDILFFPSKVKVVYFVPMSRYNEETVPIRVEASFNEAVRTSSDKVEVRVVSKAPYIRNVELLTDSVEYSLVNSGN